MQINLEWVSPAVYVILSVSYYAWFKEQQIIVYQELTIEEAGGIGAWKMFME